MKIVLPPEAQADLNDKLITVDHKIIDCMKAFEDAVYERQETIAQAYGVATSNIVDIIQQSTQDGKLSDELTAIISIINSRQKVDRTA